MKTLCQLLLIFSVLAAGLRAKDEGASPGKAAVPARELVWPEITNARALIKLAKSEIREDLVEGIHGKQLGTTKDPLLDYLKPYQTLVAEDFIVIILDTHPFTGQGFVVAPNPSVLRDTQWFSRVEDTSVREIKKVLLKLPPNSYKSLAGMESYVRWKNLTNEAPDKATCPYPIRIFSPVCPTDMSEAGIVGEAKVTFTVNETGEVLDVVTKASHAELVGPAEEAIKLWKFEPGVDRETRMPVATRVSVTAIYTPAEVWYK